MNSNEYLSKNKAFFYICSPANGIVKRIVAQEGDYLVPGDTLLYITNQSGEEDNITVTVECFV